MEVITYTSVAGNGCICWPAPGADLQTVLANDVPAGATNIQIVDSAIWQPTPPTAQQAALAQLLVSDAVMFRALEILIDTLLAKGVVAATDFAPSVRALYLARKSLRATAGV